MNNKIEININKNKNTSIDSNNNKEKNIELNDINITIDNKQEKNDINGHKFKSEETDKINEDKVDKYNTNNLIYNNNNKNSKILNKKKSPIVLSASLIDFLISTIITIVASFYGLTWAILFIIFLTKENNNLDKCKTLRNWNVVLIVFSFLIVILNCISFILQNCCIQTNTLTNISKYLITIRSCINCLVSIIILIGITADYFSIKEPQDCGDLNLLNLIYIIVEWCLFGFFTCCIMVMCIIAVITKKNKDQLE